MGMFRHLTIQFYLISEDCSVIVKELSMHLDYLQLSDVYLFRFVSVMFLKIDCQP